MTIPRILLEEGACAGKPFEWFWPQNELGEDMNNHVPREAKATCFVCRHKVLCRSYARREERWGVWAAESAEDRERWRKDNPKEGTEWTHRG